VNLASNALAEFVQSNVRLVRQVERALGIKRTCGICSVERTTCSTSRTCMRHSLFTNKMNIICTCGSEIGMQIVVFREVALTLSTGIRVELT